MDNWADVLIVGYCYTVNRSVLYCFCWGVFGVQKRRLLLSVEEVVVQEMFHRRVCNKGLRSVDKRLVA